MYQFRLSRSKNDLRATFASGSLLYQPTEGEYRERTRDATYRE
jgi:hypothetical protein